MKKQTTLFKYSFTKVVQHRNEAVDIGLQQPDFVEEKGIFPCDKCPQRFKSRAGLSSHTMWAHPHQQTSSSISDSIRKSVRVRTVEMDVNLVVNQLVTNVIREEERVENEESSKGRKGASKRKSYDAFFKLRVLEELEQGNVAADDVAFNNNIHKSLVTKWKDSKKAIVDAASAKHLRLLKKQRRSTKHDKVFHLLLKKFRKSRANGGMVSFQWLYTTANMINKEVNPGASRLNPSVVTAFKRKYGIKLRKVQRKKQKPKESSVGDLMSWHCEIREGVIKSGSNLPYFDSKWGR